MRCILGWHRWEYFAVQTNLGAGNVVRICSRCMDLQNWTNLTLQWSLTFDPNDSIAQEIIRRARVAPPYAPADIRELGGK